MGTIDETCFWLSEHDTNWENIMFSDENFNENTYPIKIDFDLCNFVFWQTNPDASALFTQEKDREFKEYKQERFFARLKFALISDGFIEAFIKKYCPIEYQTKFTDQIKARRDLAAQHLESLEYGVCISKSLDEDISRATEELAQYATEHERFSELSTVRKSLMERQAAVKDLINKIGFWWIKTLRV